MWPKVDFGNFYRFIASVGLVALIAAAVVPLLVSAQGQGFQLTVEQSEMLEEESRQVYLARLAMFNSYLLWIPAWSILLVVVGVACSWWGLVGWYQRQRNTDRREDAETKVAEASVRPTTPAERESQLREDAEDALSQTGEESAAEPSSAPASLGRQLAEQPQPQNDNESEPSTPSSGVRREAAIREMTDKLRAVDGEAMKLLAEVAEDSHRLMREVTVGTAARRARVDALLVPLESNVDGAAWIVEVSYLPTRQTLNSRALKLGRTLTAAASAFSNESGPRPVLTGLLVLNHKIGDERLEASLKECRGLLDSAGMADVNIVAIHEDELYGLDERSFRDFLHSSMREADWRHLGLTDARRTA